MESVARRVELLVEVLGPHHADLIHRFSCTGNYTEELVQFLQKEAQVEQDRALSTTFLFLSPGSGEIGAFITLSATSIRMTEGIRKKLGAGANRPYIPAVMMDYIAVSDAPGQKVGGFGLEVFKWAKEYVFAMNQWAGVRLIGLEVRAGNWKAYKRFSTPEWGFKALPLRENEGKRWPKCEAPAAELPERPAHIEAERFIPMYYDLYEHYGSYWPRP